MDQNLKIFLTLFFAIFATTTGVGLVVPLLPVYAHDMGASAFQVGLVFGAFSLTRTIFVPFFGTLSDKKGKRPFLTLGLFLYFFLSICYCFSSNVETLILLRLGHGFASAMILPVAQAYVGLITPKNREGYIMGVFNIALFAGLSIGPFMGGIVKDWVNIQFSFLSMGALTLLAFLLCLFLLPKEERSHGRPSSAESMTVRYLKIIREPGVFSLFAFRICFTTGLGIIWAFLPLIASTQFNLSSSSIGILVMISVLVNGLFQIPMGYLADRFSKTFLIIAGGILAAVCLFLINRATSFNQLFLVNALYGLAGGLSFPAIMALGVIEGRRLDSMGSIMGLLAMAHSLGMFIGPLIGGILLDLFSPSITFLGGALIMILGTAAFFSFHPAMKSPKLSSELLTCMG